MHNFNSIVMREDQKIAVECPTCSQCELIPHEVIARGHNLTVRCTSCGTMHKLDARKHVSALHIKVIVSKYDKSCVRWVDINPNAEVYLGDELIVENGEASGVKVSSLELKGGGRAGGAQASTIQTIWTYAIDKVVVKVTFHRGRLTGSTKFIYDGNQQFAIGSREKFGTITNIKMVNGSNLKRAGQNARAKDIKRIYARIGKREPFDIKSEM